VLLSTKELFDHARAEHPMTFDYNAPRVRGEIRCRVCGREYHTKHELKRHVGKYHMNSRAALQSAPRMQQEE
jgi:hypothetical protein